MPYGDFSFGMDGEERENASYLHYLIHSCWVYKVMQNCSYLNP